MRTFESILVPKASWVFGKRSYNKEGDYYYEHVYYSMSAFTLAQMEDYIRTCTVREIFDCDPDLIIADGL